MCVAILSLAYLNFYAIVYMYQIWKQIIISDCLKCGMIQGLKEMLSAKYEKYGFGMEEHYKYFNYSERLCTSFWCNRVGLSIKTPTFQNLMELNEKSGSLVGLSELIMHAPWQLPPIPQLMKGQTESWQVLRYKYQMLLNISR